MKIIFLAFFCLLEALSFATPQTGKKQNFFYHLNYVLQFSYFIEMNVMKSFEIRVLYFQITSFPLAVGVMKEHPKQLKSVTLEQRSILIADWMTSQNQLLAPQQLALTSECFTVVDRLKWEDSAAIASD